MDINKLIKYSDKPTVFEPGDSLLWTDPHIAKQMLKAHLDPNTDSASRKPETIDSIVNFNIKHLGLMEGDKILDAGCGPGLYCERFAENGLRVTGLDISSNSLAYAKESASKKGLDINYICSNYLDMDFNDEFDAIFMIWWDFCVLNHEERKRVLLNIKRALKQGGRFVFDISTPLYDKGTEEYSKWDTYESGFFAKGPHMVLEKRFNYPNIDTYLTQYIVINNSEMRIFRLYHTHYTKASITRLLNENGFSVTDIFEDLCGTPYSVKSRSLGVFASKI